LLRPKKSAGTAHTCSGKSRRSRSSSTVQPISSGTMRCFPRFVRRKETLVFKPIQGRLADLARPEDDAHIIAGEDVLERLFGCSSEIHREQYKLLFCISRRENAPDVAFCRQLTILPDHLHFLCAPPEGAGDDCDHRVSALILDGLREGDTDLAPPLPRIVRRRCWPIPVATLGHCAVRSGDGRRQSAPGA